MVKQKHFMDISRVKEDTELTEANTGAFEVGDEIVIQEKVDGSNAAIAFDDESGTLVAFSRKKMLTYSSTLNGFWNYVQLLDPHKFADVPYKNYIFFGEFLTPHTIKYKPEAYGKWYFYDVFDRETEKYLPQSEVKRIAEELGFIYVKTFYTGEFISWEHVQSFVGKSDISLDSGEGVVVKNMSKLNGEEIKQPFYLKIVAEKFSEIKKNNHIRKEKDPQSLEKRAKSQEIVEQIVTENRVRKEILKMIDEGVLPSKISPQDMSTVAKNLPRRIYDDCLKEERESVVAAGEYFGKMCNSTTMFLAKRIIFGGA